MDTSDQVDQQLIAGIAQGDEAPLQVLLQRYSPHLYQFAFSILDDHDLSQQAVSNVFISIWQRRRVLCITNSVHTYLFTAVNNQSFRMLRSKASADEVAIDDVPPEKLIANTCENDDVEFREFVSDIEAVLDKMPPERQKVFRMNSFENLRYKDIASALGISVGGVQKHMNRARAQIAAALPKLGYRFKQNSETE